MTRRWVCFYNQVKRLLLKRNRFKVPRDLSAKNFRTMLVSRNFIREILDLYKVDKSFRCVFWHFFFTKLSQKQLITATFFKCFLKTCFIMLWPKSSSFGRLGNFTPMWSQVKKIPIPKSFSQVEIFLWEKHWKGKLQHTRAIATKEVMVLTQHCLLLEILTSFLRYLCYFDKCAGNTFEMWTKTYNCIVCFNLMLHWRVARLTTSRFIRL